MQLSEFRLAVAEEFGTARGKALVREMNLGAIGGLTAEEALAAGWSASQVWSALCRENDVPLERWHGRGRPDPR
jgi:hypothetical protein